MTDWALKSNGGKVLMTTSLDERYPPENMLDGHEQSYWISTGLYPQEVLVELGQKATLRSVKITGTNLKGVRLEGCSEDTPVNFKVIGDSALPDAKGKIATNDVKAKTDVDIKYLKVIITSGWFDFASVHKISVS
mmetsp:Transcript_393/g.626  ORF Transcript_393/g.626 Transcript_393/m.626 type:complete len:135 (-) Transcript_393:149-553(-)